MSRENRWVKLSRGYLRDEKIHYIIKRHGHDTMVFWTGILTECRSGKLEMSEEVFSEVCMIEQARFTEIVKIFTDFGLVTRCNAGKLLIVNWNKYQFSESYERVKAFRERDVTGEKQSETFEKQNVASGTSLSTTKLNTSTTKNIQETEMKRDVTQVEDLALANIILADIRLINPNHKEPKLDSWSKTIRLMRERDGRKHSEILELWQWANKHQFWSSNILSPESLREKWDRLVIQKKQGGNNAKPSKLQIAAEAIRQSRRNSREPIVQDVSQEPGLRAIPIGHIGGHSSDD